MARIYAGILGPLAFLAALLRGMIHGGGPESVTRTAWYCLLGFATAGYVVGRLAEWTIEESVRGRFAAELSARRAPRAANSAAAGETAT